MIIEGVEVVVFVVPSERRELHAHVKPAQLAHTRQFVTLAQTRYLVTLAQTRQDKTLSRTAVDARNAFKCLHSCND